jgi:hypothetical protein
MVLFFLIHFFCLFVVNCGYINNGYIMIKIFYILVMLCLLFSNSTIAELNLDSFSFQDYYPSAHEFNDSVEPSWLKLTNSESHSYKEPVLVLDRASKVNETTASIFITKDTPALAYPNPFRLVQGVEIGFYSSAAFDAQFYVYDMVGHLRIKKDMVVSNTSYNLISLSSADFQGGSVSAGAYFYVLVRDDEIVRKGKMGVIP